METNDSNIKPQQTGGLKLMTVFVFVIAAHVVVIGGFTAYYLMKGGSSDADILTEQSHKSTKSADPAIASDGTTPDASQADKNATAATSTPTTDTASGAINIPAPTSSADQTASTDSSAKPTGSNPTAINPPTPTPMQHGPVITPSQPPAKTTLAAAPAMTPEAQAPVTINGLPYVVKSGDSLAKIARQHGTSVAKLKAANSLANDKLHIGQKMVIPAKTQLAAATPVAPNSDVTGTTTILGDSASAPSMTVPAQAMTTPAAGTTAVPAAAAHGHTYTVVKGDTLTKIAHKFKTTPTAIMTANNLTDATKLSIGKKLKIPGQESRSATNNEPETTPAAAQSQPGQAPAKAATTAQLANFVQ